MELARNDGRMADRGLGSVGALDRNPRTTHLRICSSVQKIAIRGRSFVAGSYRGLCMALVRDEAVSRRIGASRRLPNGRGEAGVHME